MFTWRRQHISIYRHDRHIYSYNFDFNPAISVGGMHYGDYIQFNISDKNTTHDGASIDTEIGSNVGPRIVVHAADNVYDLSEAVYHRALANCGDINTICYALFVCHVDTGSTDVYLTIGSPLLEVDRSCMPPFYIDWPSVLILHF